MKQFFASALGAFAGSIVGLIAIGFITMAFTIIGLSSISNSFGSKDNVELKDNSILKIRLEGDIPEKSSTKNNIISIIDQNETAPVLSEIIKSIDCAANDAHIKGIFLNCKGSSAGAAGSYEIRKALERFKKSKKWIYAYGDNYSQADYYIASVADSVFINPQGMLELHGLSTSIPYFKTLLDKVGVDVQVFKVGTFKSAVEPYILTNMSDANKLQSNQFLGSIWNSMLQDISASRNINSSKLNELVDSITLSRPVSYLLANKLVDAKCYAFDFMKKLKLKVNKDLKGNANFVSPLQLLSNIDETNQKDKIAVIYANGEINSSSDEGIVADKLIENILSAADDDQIKGLVLRVNSPGGSAFDSEQIWAALEEFKKTKKPFAVSMGNYAASGGYYISCGAQRIFAEPTTLTGSIGIFGMIPNIQKLVSSVGVNIEEVATNPNANFPSILKPMSNLQAQQMQNYVNQGYQLFTNRCATGRHMNIDRLRSIAEGRVWAGATALKLGLVDEIGGLENTVAWVAKSAKLKSYSIEKLQDKEDSFAIIMNKYLKGATMKIFVTPYDKFLDQKNMLLKVINIYPIQARCEMTVEL